MQKRTQDSQGWNKKGRERIKRSDFPRERMLLPAPASVYFHFAFESPRYYTYEVFPSALSGPPSLPLHCTRTIKLHFFPSFSHCHISSSGALQDIPRAYCYPVSTKNHTQGLLLHFDLGGGLSLEPLPGKATCYLQVLSAPLEDPIKSILFLGLVWINLLTSVSSISGVFILLSS